VALRPYSIRSPQFDLTSGGIRVLYGLYGWLLAKGQLVFMNAMFENPDFVGIYTDIHKGNDLGANTVVRYLLNKVGVMGGVNPATGEWETGQTSFDPTDRIYYFSKLFGETEPDNYMFLPILNTHLFRDQKKKRDRRAVFVGKGVDTGLHQRGATIIDRSLAQDQQELADLLNECEVLYSYDPVSAMTEIARLCGCRVVYLSETYTREDYANKYEAGVNGMSFGTDEGVELDTEAFTQHYLDLRETFSKRLDIFIESTQQ